MSIKPTTWKAWNIDEVQFGPAVQAGTGFKIPISYGGKPLFLQTPSMQCPFGLQNGYGKGTQQVQLSFENQEDFLTKCQQFDKRVKSAVAEQALSLAIKEEDGAPISPEALDSYIELLFNPRVNQTSGYPAYIKVPLATESQLYKPGAISVTLNSTNIPRNCKLQALIHISHIYKNGDKIGVVWKATQLVVTPKVNNHPKGVCLLSAEDN